MRYFGWLCIMLYFTAQYFQMKHFRSSITLLCWFFSLLSLNSFPSKKNLDVCYSSVILIINQYCTLVSKRATKIAFCQLQIRVAKASFVTHSDSIVCCIHMSHEALRQLPTAHKVFFFPLKIWQQFPPQKNTCFYDIIQMDGSLISLSHFWLCCYFIWTTAFCQNSNRNWLQTERPVIRTKQGEKKWLTLHNKE